jgi:hypothetical protein
MREDIKDAVFQKRSADTLLHMDQVSQETPDGYLSARGCGRRKFLQASSFMGVLAAVDPWFARLANAQDQDAPPRPQPGGNQHDGHSRACARPREGICPAVRTRVRLSVRKSIRSNSIARWLFEASRRSVGRLRNAERETF